MATPATLSLFLTLTIFTILPVLLLGGGSSDYCQPTEGVAVLFGCLKSIEKEGPEVPPSADCCKGVSDIGMKCTCTIITKEIENIISMEKLVSVAQCCGQPLPPGSQCGSYKVPAMGN